MGLEIWCMLAILFFFIMLLCDVIRKSVTRRLEENDHAEKCVIWNLSMMDLFLLFMLLFIGYRVEVEKDDDLVYIMQFMSSFIGYREVEKFD